jgi:flagellar basal-body rod protein FlgF
MPYGIYISAEGANAQSQRLEVIANNLANADTAGFKQDVPTFMARFAEAIQQGQARSHDGSINDIGGGVKLIDTATDFSAGQLQDTGQELDFAITGKGFFHVRGADGKQYLSRAGNFESDVAGMLRTQGSQLPVLDQAGKEIVLDPDLPWTVSQDGFISQDGSLIALGLSQPKSLDEMVKVGNNLFESLGPVEAVPVEERNIRQGFLEMSGADPVRQMTAMIETTRAFEANSRMVQNHDNVLGSLIGRVLRA